MSGPACGSRREPTPRRRAEDRNHECVRDVPRGSPDGVRGSGGPSEKRRGAAAFGVGHYGVPRTSASMSRRWSSWIRPLRRWLSATRASDARAQITSAREALDDRTRDIVRAAVRLDARRDAFARSEEAAISTLEGRLRHREEELDAREQALATRESAVAVQTRAVDKVAADVAGGIEATRTRLERELYVLALEERLAEAERRASSAEASCDRLASELARERATPSP